MTERDDEDRQLAEGLAVMSQTWLEMGEERPVVAEKALAFWLQMGRVPGMFSAAAAAIAGLPQPLEESAEKTERARPIRETLGVTSAETSLEASLHARDLLESLAREHG